MPLNADIKTSSTSSFFNYKWTGEKKKVLKLSLILGVALLIYFYFPASAHAFNELVKEKGADVIKDTDIFTDDGRIYRKLYKSKDYRTGVGKKLMKTLKKSSWGVLGGSTYVNPIRLMEEAKKFNTFKGIELQMEKIATYNKIDIELTEPFKAATSKTLD